MTVLGKKAFADAQGWSPSYVTQLAREGRLVFDASGGVQVEVSLAKIAATAAGTHPGVTARHAAHRQRRTADLAVGGADTLAGVSAPAPEAADRAGLALAPAPDAPDGAGPVPPAAPGRTGADEGRLHIRKYRELIANEERKIDLGLLKGDLLPRGEVDHLWHDIGVGVRASLEAAIERLCPLLAAAPDRETQAAEVRRILNAERREVTRLMVKVLRQAKAIAEAA